MNGSFCPNCGIRERPSSTPFADIQIIFSNGSISTASGQSIPVNQLSLPVNYSHKISNLSLFFQLHQIIFILWCTKAAKILEIVHIGVYTNSIFLKIA